MEWTLADFWADGGTSTFVDRIASVLGIHPSRVLVLQVYEGSVIVRMFVLADDDEDSVEVFDTEEAKTVLTSALNELVTEMNIIDASVDNVATIGNVIPPPPDGWFETLDITNWDEVTKTKLG